MSTNEWVRIKTFGKFPRQLASHSTELLDGELLISYGGTAVPFERYCSNDLYLCNLATTRIWSRVLPANDSSDESQMPSKKYGQALCLDVRSRKIYVSGGTDGFSFCIDVHRYGAGKPQPAVCCKSLIRKLTNLVRIQLGRLIAGRRLIKRCSVSISGVEHGPS